MIFRNNAEENIHLDYKKARAIGKDDPKKTEISKDVSEIIQNVCVEDEIRQYEALPQLNAIVI